MLLKLHLVNLKVDEKLLALFPGTGFYHSGDGDIFSSLFDGPTSASVDSASTIPNTDARNIPLRVTFTHEKDKGASTSWKDEVLMVREGKCWTVDDVRYMADLDFASSGTLRQVLENQ